MTARKKARVLPEAYVRPWTTERHGNELWTSGGYAFEGYRRADGVEVGSGEQRVAYELGAYHAPANRGHDLILKDGRKVEVKAVFGGTFHAASDGRGAVRELLDTVGGVAVAGIEALSRHHGGTIGWEYRQLFEEAKKSVEHGELSKGLFWGGTRNHREGLFRIVQSLSMNLNFSWQPPPESRVTVYIAGECEVTKPVSREMALYELFRLFPDRASSYPLNEFLGAKLHDPRIEPWVRNPEALRDLWNRDYVTDSFKGADLVCLVHPEEGYALVPTADLKDLVSLDRVSRGDPYFKLKSGPVCTRTAR